MTKGEKTIEDGRHIRQNMEEIFLSSKKTWASYLEGLGQLIQRGLKKHPALRPSLGEVLIFNIKSKFYKIPHSNQSKQRSKGTCQSNISRLASDFSFVTLDVGGRHKISHIEESCIRPREHLPLLMKEGTLLIPKGSKEHITCILPS